MKFLILLFIALIVPSLYAAETLVLNSYSGKTAGGTPINLSGTSPSFQNPITSEASTFGGVAGTSCAPSSNTFTCNTPPGTGTVTVTATVNGALYGATAQFTYQDILLSSCTPLTGPTAGGTVVTCISSNSGFILSTDLAMAFGGSTYNGVTFTSAAQISQTTPGGASGTISDVTVTNNNGLDEFGGTSYPFLYQDYTLTSITPSSGSVGTVIALTGTGFITGYGAMCEFSTTPVTYSTATVTSATSATCPVPAGTGTVTVNYANNGQQYTTASTTTFTYANILLFQTVPSNGKSAGTTPLKVTGSGFISGPMTCTFTISAVAPVLATVTATYVSATSLTVAAPAGTNGFSGSFYCSNTGGGNSGPLNYRWQDIVSTSLTPASGPKNGGTSITVNTQFNNIVTVNSTNQLRFGTASNGAVTASSSTVSSEAATTPSGFSGQTPEVYITNNGIDFFDTGFTFAFNDAFKAVQYSAAIIFAAIITLFVL